jgi:von Willebrand factor type A domain
MFSTANGARTDVQQVGVIISKENSMNRQQTLSEADLTRRAGIDLITVAVGTWLDPTELQGIASYPADKNTFVVTGGFAALNGVLQQIKDLACGSMYAWAFIVGLNVKLLVIIGAFQSNVMFGVCLSRTQT